jgi:hypothetical protein
MPSDEVISAQLKRFAALIDGPWPPGELTHPRAVKVFQDDVVTNTGHLIALSGASLEQLVQECQRFGLLFLYHDICLAPLLHRMDGRPSDVVTCLWAQGPRARWTDLKLPTPSAVIAWPDFQTHIWFVDPVSVREGQNLVWVKQALKKLQSLTVGGIRLHTPWDDGIPLPLSYRGSAPHGLKFLV